MNTTYRIDRRKALGAIGGAVSLVAVPGKRAYAQSLDKASYLAGEAQTLTLEWETLGCDRDLVFAIAIEGPNAPMDTVVEAAGGVRAGRGRGGVLRGAASCGAGGRTPSYRWNDRCRVGDARCVSRQEMGCDAGRK